MFLSFDSEKFYHHIYGAIHRAIQRRQHAALGEVEGRRLAVARPRQIDRNFVLDAARTGSHHHDAVAEHDGLIHVVRDDN
jgi:hypothetical protein